MAMLYANPYERAMSGLRSAGTPGTAGTYGFNLAAAEANAANDQRNWAAANPLEAGQMANAAAATPPQQTMRSRVFDAYDQQLAKYNQDARDRFGKAEAIYQGMLPQPALPGQGVQNNGLAAGGGTIQNGTYVAPEAPAFNVKPQLGIGLNAWGAGQIGKDSPLYGPQAAAHLSDVSRRGLADSTAGTNGVVLGNSMDLANAYYRDMNLQAQLQQQQYNQAKDQRDFGYGQYRDQQQRTDQNTVRLADHYVNGMSATPPDANAIIQMAQLEGQGNTDNMIGFGGYANPSVSPGGGGLYGMPGGAYGNMAMTGVGPYGVPNQSYGMGGFYSGGGGNGVGRTIDPDVAQYMRDKQAWVNRGYKGGVQGIVQGNKATGVPTRVLA